MKAAVGERPQVSRKPRGTPALQLRRTPRLLESYISSDYL